MKASEWWATRLAYMLGEAEFHKSFENKEIYGRYAAVARTQMEMNAAIESVKERTL